ncbi:phospholipase D [Artomyces pyxidatus]|uniref:Phospholipase D n=1 Tax=Artomyces pyxidatus TaxID=48021 RepID=A0ACB8SJH7_9AGAM|nr:phospholipase D [Artomyces pyxidatus]
MSSLAKVVNEVVVSKHPSGHSADHHERVTEPNGTHAEQNGHAQQNGHGHAEKQDTTEDEHPKGHDALREPFHRDAPSSPRPTYKLNIDRANAHASGSASKSPKFHSYYDSSTLTPSLRTGPPRSLSYNYSLPVTTSRSRYGNGDILEEPRRTPTGDEEDGPSEYDFTPRESQFRGALEYADPEQKEREREIAERRARRSNTSRWDEFKSKWRPESVSDSPAQERQGFDFEPKSPEQTRQTSAGESAQPADKDESGGKSPQTKWNRLRFLLPHVASQVTKEPLSSAVTPVGVNITDELISGGLSTLMLRLWFERDERDRRRVPVLLHRLRIRISDSLHPLHGTQSVFRIECEYANGAARWVIYRQLRDFLSLHTHYAVSNAYNRNVDNLPEFPRTSLPYFKFLKKEGRERGGEVRRADFARLQREALENYLISLIRSVMFHPTSNRLAGFLEISALSIHLAQSGGAQYKAGYLQLEVSSSKGGGFGRKSAGQPGELAVWDVFMLDPDFKIERPMRYYRQGLNLLQVPERAHHERRAASESGAADHVSLFGSIRSRVSKVLHPHHASNGDAPRASTSTRPRTESTVSSISSPPSSAAPSRAATPMLDPSTNTNPLMEDQSKAPKPPQDGEKKKRSEVSKHTFYIENSQMRLKLYARSERQMLQWIAALEKVAASSHYTGGNRFDSFAPIRLNVAAQWLVDGRDYFWNLSRAILLAKESIYIHDWWLSPELSLRRPGKPKYRLDRLLEKKAKEGVKIFIIVYQEVSNRTTPTDSNYTKQRMTGLHPNIMLQRSPSHFQTGTFYWAHHEKLCVIDQTIAFMGGIDLCFGRWDTSQHVLVDDPEDGEEQIWPGKDYSNGRITDFHTLTKPEEDMHDRTKVPRMPWHDVGMQVVGQPARDLGRHFVQRWNYLLRIKNHTRTMPFLLPPPEFKAGELTQMGLTGTCELQICRSAGPWSLGTPDRIEHSIQNAYLKAIQMSDHFVYIENQFFITSTVVDDVMVENKIGDAIVHRIIRAHREGTPWKCCVVIPLLPGFPFPVDHNDASSVRIILECQNRTISRGPNSIFARLRKEGIDPDEYFAVFSLRNWAKLRGDVLTTELVYIHGKVCIVDDRLAIIGSANINERSQRGDRDSELASVIRDTDMIDGTMAGKPYKVGRFAHSLRVRLMREHVGVDVDAMHEDDLMANDAQKPEDEVEAWDPDREQQHGEEAVTEKAHPHQNRTRNLLHVAGQTVRQVVHGSEDVGSKDVVQVLGKVGLKRELPDARTADMTLQEERQTFSRDGHKVPGFAGSMVPTLEEKMVAEHRPPSDHAYGTPIAENPEAEEREQAGTAPPDARLDDGQLYGAPADASNSVETDDEPPHARSDRNDADAEEKKAPGARSILRKHLTAKLSQGPWSLPTPTPKIDDDGFEDPIADSFWKDVWVAAAVHNTEIFRRVFHAVPDDLVTTWKQYKEFIAHHERLAKPILDENAPEPVGRVPSEAGDEKAPEEQGQAQEPRAEEIVGNLTSGKAKAQGEGPHGEDSDPSLAHGSTEKANGHPSINATDKGKKIKGDPPFTKQEREEMEALLRELCGHLVLYPTRFLEGEDVANNFLFNADRLMPLPIYD